MAVATPGCSSSLGTNEPTIPQTTLAANASRAHVDSARAMAVGVSQPVCPPSTSLGGATCPLMQRTDITANPSTTLQASGILGLHPSDLLAAYGLSASTSHGVGQAVAVVVAYDNPTLEADLNVYRTAFGLGPCTQLSGCLRFVYHGGIKPSLNTAWSGESDLDVQMVSAVCPKCKIVVAEAPSNQLGELVATVADAVAAGATVVSNSYSIPESTAYRAYASAYAVAGVPMTAGAGDLGYGTGNAVSFPASLPTVTAVGGTTLTMNGGTYGGETVWNDTGSGCSHVFAKPSWQTDAGCSMRTINDVAVVGDPNTGVSAFVTALGGWNVFGGTSVGSPLVASMYALAGNAKSTALPAALYAHPTLFRSITGSSGTCYPAYLCTAAAGYTGPAGVGTPNGLGAF